MDDVKGLVFNIQRYSIDDGPGIRSTVFLKGCPLSCPWCSNPESQSGVPELFHRDINCVQCGRCVAACPQQAITFKEEKGIRIDREKCVVCGQCVSECTRNAVHFMGEEKTVSEILKVVLRDRVYYESSDGGVTVSGGEALAQPEFTAALLKALREEGIHTCLDTTGYATRDVLDMILPYVSLVYFDIKHMDSESHRRATGVPNEPILDNFRYIAGLGIPITVRVPFIPGFNDSDENIEKTAEFVSSVLPGNEVGLLPYHRYGIGKYEALDREYPMSDLDAPDSGSTEHAKSIFEKHGLKCIVKG